MPRRDLVWRGRNLGEIVTILTKGRQRPEFRAHLDPDLRKDLLPRDPGWRASLGQAGRAQGHLRNQGVRAGDIFLFWGLFRSVDDELRWIGRREHRVWGWMQVGEVASVDSVARGGGAANAVPRAGRELRGLALEVDEALLLAIDTKEGHPMRYDRGDAPASAELVRTGRSVAAWLYRVTPAFEAPHDIAPRRAYLDLILEAAAQHDLGQHYVTRLHTIPVADD